MKKTILTSAMLMATFALSPATMAEDHGEEAMSYSPKYKQFEPPAEKIPKYFSMDKVVVNFQGEGRAKFLAVDLKFMSYYPQLVEIEMEHLRPILVNDVSAFLRSKTYTELSQADGTDKMRHDVLQIVKKVLDTHLLYPDLLEDVYLDRFVMQ